MYEYELTIIIDGKATEASKKSMVKKVTEIVKDNGGSVTKNEDWGKKDLAYKMQNEETGVYLHFLVELDSSKVGEFKSGLRFEEKILRYLLIRAE